MKMFLLGALGYPVLELLYRRRTHYSMGIAGGLAVMLIDHVRHLPAGLASKSVICGIGITGIEYICGQIWNRDYSVWDYRRTPLNFRGQVCLPFSLMWCGLSAVMLTILDQIRPTSRNMPGR